MSTKFSYKPLKDWMITKLRVKKRLFEIAFTTAVLLTVITVQTK